VVLKATASAGTINWYAAATGGVPLGTGSSFTTPIMQQLPIGWTQRVIVVLQVLECKLRHN
jgi:hypothetical protein